MMRDLRTTGWGVIAAAFLVVGNASVAAPPNLVWIVADDMSPDTGGYGAEGVSTPNLDRLAAEGRRYDRAFSSAPVCSSSRSAFILGTYQIKTGLQAHDVENPQPLAAPYRPVTELLREAGWFVTNAPAPGTVRNGKVIKKGKTHYNFAHDPAVMFDGDDWRKRKPGQPFFAQFQIVEPHRPFPIPDEFDEAAVASIALPPCYPDLPLIRRDWYAYQRSVEMVDRRVGDILAQLEEEGVLEETVVVFFADHGRPMPWGKQWLSMEGLQVPLLARGPGIGAGEVEGRPVSLIDLAPSALVQAGLSVPDWMDGRPVLGSPSAFPDREFVFAARDRCGDAADRIRAVISRDFLLVRNFHTDLSRLNWSGYKESSYPGLPLVRWLNSQGRLSGRPAEWLALPRPEFELYDLTTDLAGMTNVASDPARASIVQSLRRPLDEWIASSGDRGALPDPPTEPTLGEIQKAKRGDYQRVWKTRLQNPEPSDAERVEWWEKAYHLRD